jgi:DNA-binding Lrp family transcriptional regulator
VPVAFARTNIPAAAAGRVLTMRQAIIWRKILIVLFVPAIKKMLSKQDKLLLSEIQDRFPIFSRPYLRIAQKLNIPEEYVIKKIKVFKKKDIIRYIGGIFDNKKLGAVSTLVAMSVPVERLNKTVRIINAYPSVSHNYLRDADFNLWFTLSASSKSKLSDLLSRIKKQTKMNKTLDLATIKVFKIDARFNLRADNALPGKNFSRLKLNPKAGRLFFDKKLIAQLNQPLDITSRPFVSLAKKLNLTEGKVLATLKSYKKTGLLRRFGAILSHRNIGLKTNALVAWKAPVNRVDSVAKTLTAYPAITHCYLRNTYSFWPYNIYSMLHSVDRGTASRLIQDISRKIKINDFRVLFTLKEFKKTKADLNQIFK